MSSVDNRIVQMQFDNQQFESGISESLNSLEKLEKSLNFQGMNESVRGIQNGIDSIDFESLNDGISNIGNYFTLAGQVAFQTLERISSKVVDLGEKMVKTFTIDPVKTGMQEYETQINAVQTILSNTRSKGTTLLDVNDALRELNTYADLTIYNFTEMTRNIGTFTAAGVDLETSTAAIKGIANLAAVSGSTSEQASRAMYQLSQALSSGTVKLMDWNSVVNAGMGGQVFQDALKDTARVHGIAIDQMIKDNGSFRETLSKGWLTSDILTETLQKFTGDLTEAELISMGYTKQQAEDIVAMGQDANDAATKVKTLTQLMDTLKEAAQSGWTQTWEWIIGDFEEAKKFLSDVSDVFSDAINNSSKARNDMLEGWHELGGRDSLIESFWNSLHALFDVLTQIGSAFREVFPKTTSEQLFDITKAIEEITKKFKMSDDTAKNLHDTAKGLFSVLDIGVAIAEPFVKAFGKLVGFGASLVPDILEVTAEIGNFITHIDESIRSMGLFEGAADSVIRVFEMIRDEIKNVIKGIKDSVDDISNGDFTQLDSVIETIGDKFKTFNDKFGKFIDGISNMLPSFEQISNGISNALRAIGDAVNYVFKNVNFQSILEFLSVYFLSQGVNSFFQVADCIGVVQEALEGMVYAVQFDKVVKIAESIAILAASMLVLSTIDSESLYSSVAAMGLLFAELGAFMRLGGVRGGSTGGSTGGLVAAFSGMMELQTAGEVLLVISAGIALLAIALKNLSSIDISGIIAGLIGLGGVMTEIGLFIKIMGKNGSVLLKGSQHLVVFSVAINVMADAVEKLASINFTSLIKGLGALGIVMGEIAIFTKIASGSTFSVGSATGILIISGAVVVLAEAIDKLGNLDPIQLAKGLGVVSALIVEMGVFAKVVNGGAGLVLTATGVTIMASAMIIFGEAIDRLGNLDLKVLAVGLGAMAVAIVEMIAAVKLMPEGEMVSFGVGLTVISGALVVLAEALNILGGLSLAQMAIALGGLAVALAEIAVAMAVMGSNVSGAASIAVMAGAMTLLAGAMAILGSLSIGQIATSLGALAAAFVVLGVAGALLTPVVPTISSLAAAFALIGGSLVVMGAGLTAISVGITAMAGSTVAVGATILGDLQMLLAVVPTVFKALADGIISFIETLADAADRVSVAGVKIINALLDAFKEVIPNVVEVGFAIINTLLDALINELPNLVSKGVDLIVALIDALGVAIEENGPRIVDSVIGLGASIVSGLSQGIIGGVGTLISEALGVVDKLVTAVKDKLGIHSPSTVFKEIGSFLMEGFSGGIIGKAGDLVKTIGNFIGDGIKSAKDTLSSWLNTGADLVSNIVSGITQQLPTFLKTITDAMTKGLDMIKKTFNDWQSMGQNLIVKVIAGIGDKFSDYTTKINSLMRTGITTAQDSFESWYNTGSYLIEGMIDGMYSMSWALERTVRSMARSAVAAAMEELDEHSPSRVFYGIGAYVAEGFALGINQNGTLAESAATNMANDTITAMSSAIDRISDYISNGIDANPVIAPVFDLTNVNAGIEKINSDFASTKFNLKGSMDLAQRAAISSGGNLVNAEDFAANPAQGNTFNFTQNNYSPKALSRIDIYRQTNNQFTTFKGAVST